MAYRLSDDANYDIDDMYSRGFWEFGEHQADRFYRKIFSTIDSLSSFPDIGTRDDSLSPGLLRMECNPYAIFYLKRRYGVYVLRIMRQEMVVRSGHFTHSLKSQD